MLKMSRYKEQVKINLSASSTNRSVRFSEALSLFAALNASCNLTRDNIRNAMTLTEKNNVPAVRAQISNMAQPI
jgi:hypothetical protein